MPHGDDTPARPRVSSPVEVATTFRLTPPVGMKAVAAAPLEASPAPAAPEPVPATEDYAAVLMRRLAAMAPPDFDEEQELEANPRMSVFGEDVGPKGGVHAVTLGLQERFGRARVFDTSLNEEGIAAEAFATHFGAEE